MRILTVADAEVPYLYEYYSPRRTEGVELIISCGDMHAKYLEFLTTVVNKPLLYVHGNHDTSYAAAPPEGCIPIEDTVYEFKGIRIAGLGGSYKYKKTGLPYMCTEQQMKRRVKKLGRLIRMYEGVDIIVAHAPCEGYGDRDDLPHWGFSVFNDLLNEFKPKYFLYGHVHKEYGDFEREIVHESGTTLINCYESHLLEFDESAVRPHTEKAKKRIRLHEWWDHLGDR